jgi:aerobic-type carbon monoxide dehydrogenase small subunit (CoxS/CutS family)
MILSTIALLERHNHKLTDREITSGMNGNICRCGTYYRIMDAIRAAATMSRSTIDAER